MRTIHSLIFFHDSVKTAFISNSRKSNRVLRFRAVLQLEGLIYHIYILNIAPCFNTDSEQVRLPVWLQTLMDACCLASDFSLQGVAISLLMDLVGLTQSVAMVTAESVASGSSSESAQPMSPSQGRVAVVIRPPLTQGILKFIADKTDFFKVEVFLSVTLELSLGLIVLLVLTLFNL